MVRSRRAPTTSHGCSRIPRSWSARTRSASPGPRAERGKPHPRMYGTFPRVLAEHVRERKLISLETAVNKMTGMSAKRLGLRDRGLLHPGQTADVTVFDPATVRTRRAPWIPTATSGIPYVYQRRGGRGRRQMHAAGTGRVLTPVLSTEGAPEPPFRDLPPKADCAGEAGARTRQLHPRFTDSISGQPSQIGLRRPGRRRPRRGARSLRLGCACIRPRG